QDVINGPVPGAEVSFIAPAAGPGGVFTNGTRTTTVSTDAQGVAVSIGFRPNNVTGDFQINVEASFEGKKFTVTINQSNVPPKQGGRGKWMAIVAVAAGVAAAAAVAGGKGGGSQSTSQPPSAQTPTAIRATAGAPTV